MLFNDIIAFLESIAPLQYQENYDNCGLLVGDKQTTVTGVLTTLDVTEAIIEEAIANNCNLVVAHHPVIFKGIKKINNANAAGRIIIKAILNNIGIYAIHTNLDNVIGGVNYKIAEKIGLQNVAMLLPKKQLIKKLTVFVPQSHIEILTQSLHKAGAGHIGNYTDCSFTSKGIGSFKPNDKSNPHVGEKNILEKVKEYRLEVIFPMHIEQNLIAAMYQMHPYEEVAYDITVLENTNQEIGSGTIGITTEKYTTKAFLLNLKEIFGVHTIKHTEMLDTNAVAKNLKIAVCGGAGSFLLPHAIAQNADIFISSDFKYHEYFEAQRKILIADIGHYESEQFTKYLLYELISKKFANIVVLLSKTNTNPVHYL